MRKNNLEPKIVSFKANMGGNPEEKSLAAREIEITVFDEILERMVTKAVTQPEKNFLTYSVAFQTKEMDKPHWIRCYDEDGNGFRLRKGDRAEFTGYFKDNSFVSKKTGEIKTVQNFVVTGVRPVKIKVREEIP